MGDMLWGVEEEKSVGGYWLILKGPKSKYNNEKQDKPQLFTFTFNLDYRSE